MDKEEYVFRTTLTAEARKVADKVKSKRGLILDSELIRILLMEESRRLGLETEGF